MTNSFSSLSGSKSHQYVTHTAMSPRTGSDVLLHPPNPFQFSPKAIWFWDLFSLVTLYLWLWNSITYQTGGFHCSENMDYDPLVVRLLSVAGGYEHFKITCHITVKISYSKTMATIFRIIWHHNPHFIICIRSVKQKANTITPAHHWFSFKKSVNLLSQIQLCKVTNL